MDLGTNQLKAAIVELLKSKDVHGSVRDEVNEFGEVVIVVTLRERCPACGGTGKKIYPKPDKP